MKIKDKVDVMLEEDRQAYDEAEAFKAEVNKIYQQFKDGNQELSKSDNTKLNELLVKPISVLDIESYVSIMYMKGVFYDKENNRNGARYCAMRLLWMKECYTKRGKKRSRYLDMHPYTFDETICSFIERYTDFLQNTYRSIRNRLLAVSLVLLLCASAAMVFLVHIHPLIATLEAGLLCGLNYWIQMRRMPDMFQKNQTNVIEKYIEEELLSFDRIFRIR